MDIALLFFLILLNGILAMSEIAVVSSRQSRLQKLADDGQPGARSALALNHEPSIFLSTVQVGITTVGILSGAIGDAALAAPLGDWLTTIPSLAPYARPISLTLVVCGVTYFAVVVGELVPKRLGLLAPERIASLIAPPMNLLSRFARPLVWLLSSSSSLLLRLLGARQSLDSSVSDDEIKILMGQGARAGVFHASEQEIVANVLRLDQQRVGEIMTHRKDLYLIDLNDGEVEIRDRLAASPFKRVLVCRDGLDNLVGVLRTSDLLKGALSGAPLAIEDIVRPPLYVPASVNTTQLLETFRRARQQCALMVDEYGELQGLVTLTDVLTSIVGDLPAVDSPEEQGHRRARRRLVAGRRTCHPRTTAQRSPHRQRTAGGGRKRLPHARWFHHVLPRSYSRGRRAFRVRRAALRGRRHGSQSSRQGLDCTHDSR
jgi:putative hemolysin